MLLRIAGYLADPHGRHGPAPGRGMRRSIETFVRFGESLAGRKFSFEVTSAPFLTLIVVNGGNRH